MNNAHRLLRFLAGLFAVATALAQGTVAFANYNGNGINAPVYDTDGVTKLGSAFYAQLYAGPTADSLAPAGIPIRFKDYQGKPTGYFIGGKVAIPSVAEGTVAYCQVRAWPVCAGESFEAAQAGGARWGVSNVLRLGTGGDHLDPPLIPAPLTGLASFTLVPEPGTASLLMAGFGGWFLWRHTKAKSRATSNSDRRPTP